MPRLYLVETRQALYEAIIAHPPLGQILKERRILKDDKTGRIRRVVFRAKGDFPSLFIRIGPNDRGMIRGIQTFATEETRIPHHLQRSGQITMELAWDGETEDQREQIEAEILGVALVSTLDAAMVGSSYERRRGPQQVTGPQGTSVTRDATVITFTFNYMLDRADALPSS